jgi:signal recognition particle subunit SRP54
MALLEADVNYKVAKDFVESVRSKAEGQEVWQGLNPHEQVVKIVYDELVNLMAEPRRGSYSRKQIPNVVMSRRASRLG